MKLRLFLGIVLLGLGHTLPAATILWTNLGGGSWSVPANWSPNQIPGASDNVVITLAGSYTVNFNLSGSTVLAGSVTLGNGGLLAVQSATAGSSLALANGGALTILKGSSLLLYSPLNNFGVINMTNASIAIINNQGQGAGGLINEAGGLINLKGIGSISAALGQSPGYYSGYVTNEGVITQGGGTNTISVPAFDNTLGLITNLSGTLSLGLLETLAGTYNAAPGATLQFSGGSAAAPLEAETPLLLGGGGSYQFTSGYLYLALAVPTNLTLLGTELEGTTVELGPDFQGGTITNLTLAGMAYYGYPTIELLNMLPVTGIFSATNSVLNGSFTVEGGGTFNVNSSTFNSVTVNPLGTLNVQGPVTLVDPLLNSGTINISNSLLTISSAGLINQRSGLINFAGNGGITVSSPGNYLTNQGTIIQNSGSNAINYQTTVLFNDSPLGLNEPFNFDNSQGVIYNFSGTLVLPSLQSNLTGSYFAASGATVELGGGTSATPLTTANFYSLGGSGQYQFVSGYLYLAGASISNLSLQGGMLELDPAFEGGAITNLILDGITLSNSLPITGVFTVLNSGSDGTLNAHLYNGFYGNGVSGTLIAQSGGSLMLSNATVTGAVTAMSGGLFAAGGNSTLNGNLTVANGGLAVVGESQIFGAVTITAGGTFSPAGVFLYGPLTNSGTMTLTNGELLLFEPGPTNTLCNLVNLPGGVIAFWDTTSVGGYGSYIGGGSYLLNQGQMTGQSGLGLCGLNFPTSTNAGTITSQTGPMLLGGQWTLLPSSTLNVSLDSPTVYGSFMFSTNYEQGAVGNAALAGSFNAGLNGSYVPTNGSLFALVSYGSYTGGFNLGLPAAVYWQSAYGTTNVTLIAGAGKPQFGVTKLSGGSLLLGGINGTPGNPYTILGSPDPSLPLNQWTIVATGSFDGFGNFSYSSAIAPATPSQFFVFMVP